ncbi:MAG TPA: TonB family protein, partial [Verrucomicrobiae bacterium]
TQKKCLLASATSHGFLILIILIGSAFFVPQQKQVLTDQIRVFPSKLVESALSGGGGNPNVPKTDDTQKGTPHPVDPAPPPPQPVRHEPKPKPTPPEQHQVQPKPVKHDVTEPVKPKVEKIALTPVTRPKIKPDATKPKEKIDDSILTPVVRNNAADNKRREQEKARLEAQAKAAREEARHWQESNRELARVLEHAADQMQQGFPGGTKVDIHGTGGVAYANYASFVQAIYDDAWEVQRDFSSNDFATTVKVTIARDGTVISARISDRSGNSVMDKSVQRALDKVKFVHPFPEGTTDSERTFTIEFNLKAKRLIG